MGHRDKNNTNGLNGGDLIKKYTLTSHGARYHRHFSASEIPHAGPCLRSAVNRRALRTLLFAPPAPSPPPSRTPTHHGATSTPPAPSVLPASSAPSAIHLAADPLRPLRTPRPLGPVSPLTTRTPRHLHIHVADAHPALTLRTSHSASDPTGSPTPYPLAVTSPLPLFTASIGAAHRTPSSPSLPSSSASLLHPPRFPHAVLPSTASPLCPFARPRCVLPAPAFPSRVRVATLVPPCDPPPLRVCHALPRLAAVPSAHARLTSRSRGRRVT
ncbi:hypothetical protein DFH08DRAFT_958937 [Mycena albidolilacea]|uniref:Uncharacterized protein n=1 Tax=Mycena albidolilacea TaxID=1033008 RepID=A0AAD7A5M3_9AGAR|nr:hypothetical protein DFH08DRAFT_958937 [Mycena albidolilacea]